MHCFGAALQYPHASGLVLLQVRNAQLDKEAAELRRESVELSHAAHEALNGIANSQEVVLLHICLFWHNCMARLLSRLSMPLAAVLTCNTSVNCYYCQVAEMKAEVNKLKDELAPVYKDKARLTEELMQCRETLRRVRDINEKHSKALDEATSRIRDLQTRIKELSQQVDTERATQAVAASELEVLSLFLCTFCLRGCLRGWHQLVYPQT